MTIRIIPHVHDSGNHHLTSSLESGEKCQIRSALERRLIKAIRGRLLQAIDDRLQELAGLDSCGNCLVCGYESQPDICYCCQAGCWPPYNEYFRCEVTARLAWLGLDAGLEEFAASEGRTYKLCPFPGDRPPPSPLPANVNGNLFERLKVVDLAEWAAQFTRLNPVRPNRWKGLCPLHHEKTPSFYVDFDPAKGWRWRCFGGCANGGDIVALARELERIGRR